MRCWERYLFFIIYNKVGNVFLLFKEQKYYVCFGGFMEIQILDVDYVQVDEKPIVRIFGKTEKEETMAKYLNIPKSVLIDKTISNTQRILILITLYLSTRLMFIELSRITGIDKGRLEYHLEILEREGLVKRRNHITLLGPRVYVEITERGEEIVEKIIDLLNRVKKNKT